MRSAARPKTPRILSSRGIIFHLSRADLLNEWILALCLVMAVAAVLSPLLILFGLKFGTIETLRHRLVQDPRNREIRPMLSKVFDQAWFRQIASRRDVAFVVPMTRQISASIDAILEKDGSLEKASLDLVPTSGDDPLVLENGATIPEGNQCVLTQSAAEALGAEPGDLLIGHAKRVVDTRYETGELKLEVAGILSSRASSMKAAFVPLQVVEAVERYKDGQTVPEYGWSGTPALAYPVYDGVLALLRKPMTRVDEFKLVSGTGFTRIEQVTSERFKELSSFEAPPDRSIYLIHTIQKPVTRQSLEAVKLKLRGSGAVLIPWIKELQAELTDPAGKVIGSLTLHSVAAAPRDLERFPSIPLNSWTSDGDSSRESRRALLPKTFQDLPPTVLLRMMRSEDVLSFPIEVIPKRAPEARTIIPVQLGGVLNLFTERNIAFDPGQDQFVTTRRGYAGFRLYAATIDDVDGLKRHLEAAGIPVHTEAQRIRDVMELDRYLTLLFLLISAVGVCGGIAVLTASLYASVERKRKELSVLRLIGFSGGALFRFPVYQGLLIAGAGFLVALAFFFVMAWTVNALFRSHLQAGESFCRLSAWHLALSVTGVGVLASLASFAAAWRVARIDPAESLRDE